MPLSCDHPVRPSRNERRYSAVWMGRSHPPATRGRLTRPPRISEPLATRIAALAATTLAGSSMNGLATVIINVCGGLESTPPLSVPPSSLSTTVTTAVPLVFGSGVNINMPLESIAG